MGIGILSTGTSGMAAAYTQLQITAHNIANVNTPGYTRQEAVLGSAGANFTGSGYIGRGVETVTVQRRYDEFLTREVRQTQAASAGQSVRAQEMGRIEQLFSSSAQGLGAAMDNLASAWGDVVNSPYDSAARSAVLARANTLTARVASYDQQLEQVSQDIDTRMIQAARAINPSLQTIAKLNDQLASMSANKQTPNDLLDLRDKMITDINKSVRTVTYENPDGTVNLFTASGEALVLGNKASSFGAQTSPLDGSLQLTLTSSESTSVQTASSLGAGELAGMLQFRDEDLVQVRAGLGQMVGSMAWMMNQIQTSGTDIQGNAASPLFAYGTGAVRGSSENTGTASFSVAVADGTQLSPSDYEMSYAAGQYSIRRLSDDVTVTSATMPTQFDGLTISQTGGSISNGDTFMVRAASAFTRGFAVAVSQPSQLAAGMRMTAVSSTSNTGDVAGGNFLVQAGGVTSSAPVTLTFTSASTFNVNGTGTGNPNGLGYGAGNTISYNGWTMTLNGTPKAGDVITVTPTAQPNTDNRNAQRMLDSFRQITSNGSTYTGRYADMVAQVGVQASGANDAFTLSDQMRSNAEQALSQVSGVNLDEEAARMIQFQQAYQAAAKLISTGQSMFESLMNAMG